MTVVTSPFQRIHDLLNGKGDSKEWYSAPCPAHDDKNPSLSYRETETGGVWVGCWAGCSREAILTALHLQERDLYKPGHKPVRHINIPPLSINELAYNKKIPWQALFSFGVTDDYKHVDAKGKRHTGVRIASRHRDGTEHTKIRLRYGVSGHDCYWIDETPGAVIPYGMWKLSEAEKSGYLLTGEGESDGWTCWLHGVPYLGIPGATMTNCLETIDIAEMFANIPRVYILQEPDQAEKAANLSTGGQGFYASVFKHLRNGGYKGEIFHVNYKKLTGYKDPNEMHQALVKDQSVGLFKEMLEEALQKADPANDKIEQDQTTFQALDKAIAEKDIDEMYKNVFALASLDIDDPANVAIEEKYFRDIKAVFGKDANSVKIRQIITKERKRIIGTQRQETTDLDTVAELFAEQHGDVWAYDIVGQTWRKFTGTHWSEPASEEDGKTELDKIIVGLLHELDFEVKSNGTLDCVHRLAKGKCKRLFVTRSKAVNFANGTLDLERWELQAHTKEDCFLYCLEYPFDFSGDYPQTRETLKSILCVEQTQDDGSKVHIPDYHAIQALMTQEGLALIRDTKLHNSISLYGAKRAGKSTLMRHANSVCGNATPGRLDPTDRYSSFAGDDLFSSELEGKRTRFIFGKQTLVCADEIKPEAIRDNEGIYKDMAAHSGVPMRGIGKDDVKDNTWRPKLIMSVNEIPHYRDTSGAIAERTLYLHTPLTRQKEGALKRDLNLLEKMVVENGAYARDCIRLAMAALERSYIPMSTYMKQWSKIAETNGNALKAFVEEKCVLEPNAKTHTDVIYQAFLAFRENNGHDKRYAKPTLTMALREMNIGISSSTNAIMIEGEQKRGLYGIRLKTEGEAMLPSEGKQEKNDPLLLALSGLTQVDDLTTPILDRQPHRQPTEGACEASSLSQVDDLTTENKKLAIREIYISQEKKAQTYISLPTGSNGAQKCVKSSTPTLNQPVEPSETLTLPVNRASTGRQLDAPRQVKPLKEF